MQVSLFSLEGGGGWVVGKTVVERGDGGVGGGGQTGGMVEKGCGDGNGAEEW